ncbi:MAG: glyoxalase [Flavobacteriaceae bacterium]|jgi:hypothetical protein|nr:glyoxalase [Candidatus Arcticimaribacter sp.]MDA8897800.1 glyoxalase [Flavobacteriaceae bacterium]MDB4066668.1 glyoxalase [Flavobacteriaceae bacterium]MDB9987745.1 glyoxalase [Flavobacteriaceae bacterium]|tara:strand:- start:257 stop:679 length:423 start_codon:yes stop_codon:yes gene_type:complete
MNDRPNDLLRIRPEIKKTKQFDSMSAEERFQNETLRPILKLQNPLLVAVFLAYIEMRKGVFYGLSLTKKLDYIEAVFIKDQKFNNTIKGMVVGHFTISEYNAYTSNASAINKRIMSMVIERIKDQVQLFEKSEKQVAISA